MKLLITAALFAVTAVAEIIGCYLPLLWLRNGKSVWLLFPAAVSLAIFAWLLTLHPAESGRIYAAYGGVYVSVAGLWLWLVDGVRPDLWDVLGIILCLCGMAVIVLAPHQGASG
jgi:small multidrug resistance family-3 protein